MMNQDGLTSQYDFDMLLVMRHAKSDWSAGTNDHQRPLNKRGRKAARRMGKLLSEMGLTPDLIITSTAVRATTTAKLAAEGGDWTCPIRETDDFYETSVGQVLNELRKLNGHIDNCLVIGHDTTCSRLVQVLTGSNAAMRTATVAVIDVGGPWSKIGNLSAELVALLQPRYLT